MTRLQTQQRLDDALTRLLAGQPTITDGALNVTNLCLEAAVGRDSFYRSNSSFLQRFAAAKANREQQQPELAALRTKYRDLTKSAKEAAAARSKQIQELEHTIRVYANHIQALALRNKELLEENQRLLGLAHRADHTVVPLRQR